MQEDRERENDERTMLLLQSVANSINPCVQMIVDYPSAHVDKTMPCLDFQCWVGDSGRILYEFYRKPMCPQSTIYVNYSLAWKVKSTVHMQEGVRIFLTCSE